MGERCHIVVKQGIDDFALSLIAILISDGHGAECDVNLLIGIFVLRQMLHVVACRFYNNEVAIVIGRLHIGAIGVLHHLQHVATLHGVFARVVDAAYLAVVVGGHGIGVDDNHALVDSGPWAYLDVGVGHVARFYVHNLALLALKFKFTALGIVQPVSQ